jgi:hypothetical protein
VSNEKAWNMDFMRCHCFAAHRRLRQTHQQTGLYRALAKQLAGHCLRGFDKKDAGAPLMEWPIFSRMRATSLAHVAEQPQYEFSTQDP